MDVVPLRSRCALVASQGSKLTLSPRAALVAPGVMAALVAIAIGGLPGIAATQAEETANWAAPQPNALRGEGSGEFSHGLRAPAKPASDAKPASSASADKVTRVSYAEETPAPPAITPSITSAPSPAPAATVSKPVAAAAESPRDTQPPPAAGAAPPIEGPPRHPVVRMLGMSKQNIQSGGQAIGQTVVKYTPPAPKANNQTAPNRAAPQYDYQPAPEEYYQPDPRQHYQAAPRQAYEPTPRQYQQPARQPAYQPVQQVGYPTEMPARMPEAPARDRRFRVRQVEDQQPTVQAAPLPSETGVPVYEADAPAELAPPPPGGKLFEEIDQTGDLTVILRRSKLLRTKADIFRTAVVDPSICDVIQFTPREVSIIGRGQGATHVTFWFRDGASKPVTYLVKVTPDPSIRVQIEDQYKILQEVITEMFPNSKVKLIPVADKLIVKGQAKDAEEAAQILALVRGQGGNRGGDFGRGYGNIVEGSAANVLSAEETGRQISSRTQVVNMLRIPGVQQVALRVKIAELNRTAARGFGVDVRARIDFGGSSNLFLESMLNVVNGGAPALIANLDGNDINIGIRYLQKHGVLRILSEPTLVTLSGKPATFVAGGEFAVPTIVGVGGASGITTDFRSFGVIISFMPTVLDKDRIRLDVSPEFSQINADLAVGQTPGLNVRAVTTTVEMREGQTLAIAGLLDDQMKADTTGDLPFLAQIFGRRNVSRSETELIILVTPELVHPMEPEEVPPLPGFDVTEPTNHEFFIHGKIEGLPTQEYRSTVWPRLQQRYRAGGPAMTSGPFGHGQ